MDDKGHAGGGDMEGMGGWKAAAGSFALAILTMVAIGLIQYWIG